MATEALVLKQPPTSELTWVEAATVTAPANPRVDFGGTQVHQIDRSRTFELMREFASSGRAHRIVTVNLDFLRLAEDNPAFRSAINGADLAVADGMPLVWLSRLYGRPLPERVTGVDLIHEGCRIAIEQDRGIFLLGARDGVAAAAGERLQRLHPGLRIAGVFCPPQGPMNRKNHRRALKLIEHAAPIFLFVAFGAPRQDLWIAEHLSELNVGAAMGVGGVFDLLAGHSSRAPLWMQSAGLEWAYRLGREPRRLWRRYIVDDMPVFGRLILRGLRPGTQSLVVPT